MAQDSGLSVWSQRFRRRVKGLEIGDMGSGFLDILEVLDNLGVPESGGSGCSGGSGVSGGACAIHGSTQTLREVWCTSRPSER